MDVIDVKTDTGNFRFFELKDYYMYFYDTDTLKQWLIFGKSGSEVFSKKNNIKNGILNSKDCYSFEHSKENNKGISIIGLSEDVLYINFQIRQIIGRVSRNEFISVCRDNNIHLINEYKKPNILEFDDYNNINRCKSLNNIPKNIIERYTLVNRWIEEEKKIKNYLIVKVL